MDSTGFGLLWNPLKHQTLQNPGSPYIRWCAFGVFFYHLRNARQFRFHYCWWFRNPANQLRLVVYPIICRVFSTIQKVVVWDFWTISSPPFYVSVVGSLGKGFTVSCSATGHLRGLWRLRRRQVIVEPPVSGDSGMKLESFHKVTCRL